MGRKFSKVHFAKIQISEELKNEINQYLESETVRMNQYGWNGTYSRNDSRLTFTAKFDNGCQADISVVWDGCYIDAVLFDELGQQMDLIEPYFLHIHGTYFFEYGSERYAVSIDTN